MRRTRVDEASSGGFVFAVVVLALAIATVVARRRGYPIGGKVYVRCRQGHVFTTIWVPGASLKAIRLGWYRFQYCPVGKHLALVHPVKETDLTEEELRGDSPG